MPNNKHTEELKEQAQKDVEIMKMKARFKLAEQFLNRKDGKKPQLGGDSLWNVKLIVFIDSLIDRTVQSERERIVGIIKCQMEDIEDNEYSIAWNDALKRIISLITNNSDINK